MKKFQIEKVIDHPKLAEPNVSHHEIEAVSLCAAVKRLKISGKQACDLKSRGETEWTDEHGGFHVMTIKEAGAA